MIFEHQPSRINRVIDDPILDKSEGNFVVTENDIGEINEIDICELIYRSISYDGKNSLETISSIFAADGAILRIIERGAADLIADVTVGDIDCIHFSSKNTSGQNPLGQRVMMCHVHNDFLLGSLIFVRKPSSGAFSHHMISEVEKLKSHFSRCINLYTNLRKSPIHGRPKLVALMNLLDRPLGLANFEGHIEYLNASAQQLLGIAKSTEFQFDAFWFAACAQANVEGYSKYDFNRQKETIAAKIYSLPNKNKISSKDQILINFSIKNEDMALPIGKMASDFGLTDAEQQVIKLLAIGKNVNQIAGIRNAKRETIRAQLRSIRTKLNVSSQLEMLWLLDKYKRDLRM